MDRFRLDLLHAWRAARARPGATAATMLVLALGLGLTTAMFAVADPYLLAPLPYAHARQLVVIRVNPQRQLSMDADSLPTLADWRARTDLFDGVAAFRFHKPLRVLLAGTTISLRTMEVTGNFFDVLQAPAAMSTLWRDGVGTAESAVAVSPEALAQMQSAGADGPRPGLGRAFELQGGGAIRVMDVLPSAFVFPRDDGRTRIDALLVTRADRLIDQQNGGAPNANATAYSAFTVIGRLRSGIQPEAARSVLLAGLPANAASQITLEPLDTYMTRRVRPLALGVLIAGVLILVICAGNVANLLLARGLWRARQFATRECLGATRWDLVRLVLVELGVLQAGGLIGGLLLAGATLIAMSRLMPDEYAVLGTPTLTSRAILFAGVMSAIVMLAGLIPAWLAWRLRAAALVGQIATTERRGVRWLRYGMAMTQTILAMVLLVGASLLIRSYFILISQDDGFSGELTVASVSYPSTRVGVPLRGDIDETLDHLRHLEGVQSAAAAVGPMVDRSNTMSVISVRGRSMPVAFKSVTPDYFDVVGSRLLAGRSLTDRDRNGVAVVVNETFARRFGSSESALGLVLSGSPPSEVVGVVRDTFDVALDAAPAPTAFALLEAPWADCVGSCTNVVHYVLRLQVGSRSIDAAVQREVARVNHAAVIAEISPLRARLVRSIRDKSFATLIFTLFAATSLAVCVAGLVGIVAFTVARRTREIAIRVAIGATPRDVLWMVCNEALRAAMAGAVAGALIGGWLSRTLQHFLYGVQPGDLSTLILSAAGMLTLSATAGAITASRALRRSPIDALRVE